MHPLAPFSINLLLTRLPAPPCHLLAIGAGFEASSSLLDRQGYRVRYISSVAQQSTTDPAQSADSGTFIHSHAGGNFAVPAERFDGLLVAHPVEPLIIFNLAIDYLSLAGDLVIIDQFVHMYDAPSSNHFPVLKEIIALAERCGFELLECIDVSREHALAVEKTSDDLDLLLDPPTSVKAPTYSSHENHRSGIFALLHFRKKMLPKWRIRILEKAQIDDMRSLFRKTFHHDMSRAFWEWKYDDSSARAVGIWEGHQLIAHYGGMGRRILYFGQPQTAVQIGDVMVDSSKRGVLTKKGPIFLMMATFLERYIGYGKPYFIGYGFPNDRHMKLAELLGLYADVGYMVECSWSPHSRLPLWSTRLRLIQKTLTDAEKKAIDSCWQRMAADLQGAIIGIRDWRYLEHRYLNHPAHDYQFLIMKNRLSSKVRGIFVLRLVPEGCELVDCVAALSDIPLLITHARRLAGMQGAARLFCRITANFAHLFKVAGGIQHPINIRIPTNMWSNGPSAAVIKDHWWLMSGDMDFR